MEYVSKTFRLDEEVVKRLEELKAEHGSVNKGLRRVLLPYPVGERGPEFIVPPGLITREEAMRPLIERTSLDAIGPELSSGRGKTSTEVVRRGPRQKGDKTQ